MSGWHGVASAQFHGAARLQYEGQEGKVRPQSARPSDHRPSRAGRTAAAPGRLSERPGRSTTPGAGKLLAPTSRRAALTSGAPATPPPASHTESAVLAALKKSGLLDRLGNSAPDKPASVKRCAYIAQAWTVGSQHRPLVHRTHAAGMPHGLPCIWRSVCALGVSGAAVSF